MFKVASMCCNTSPQARYPGWCRGSDGVQGDIIPCFGQHFLQHLDWIDFTAHRLQTWEQKWPDTKVHDIQMWSLWWPIRRNDEVWSVSLQPVDSFGCSMRFCAVLLPCPYVGHHTIDVREHQRAHFFSIDSLIDSLLFLLGRRQMILSRGVSFDESQFSLSVPRHSAIAHDGGLLVVDFGQEILFFDVSFRTHCSINPLVLPI